MNKIAILLFTILPNLGLFAQNTSKISGTVIDNTHPVEYASVSISKSIDSGKVIHFETTDSSGHFIFEKVESGEYIIRVKMLGYNLFSQKLSVSKERSEYVLNKISLTIDNNSLKEVTVTAQKQLITKTNEGFVMNTSNNITQIGGTATDLLKVTPTISVDNDGAITLRGKTPLILINGRNSNLSNADLIPASSIESIEVINNASSKYDANAESGIINIRLKKNKQSGINGAVALGAGMGSRGRVNSSFILNNKSGKFNFNVGYDNRFAGRTKKIINSRTNYNIPDTYTINQNRNDERIERLQNLKLALDYTPNEKHSFSFEAIGNLEGQDNDEALVSLIRKQNNSFAGGTDRHSIELKRSQVVEFALNYARIYKNTKKSLTASLSSSIENGKENTDISTQDVNESMGNIGSVSLQKTHTYEDGVVSNAMLDYAVPTSKNGVLELGYKGIFRSIKIDFETSDKINTAFVINPLASNRFNYNEQVQAAYVQYHSILGNGEALPNWSYAAGLRAEQVNNKGYSIDKTTDFSNSYLKLFPTANLGLNITQSESIKISYGKRINRPGLGQLNPFVDITDILNPHSGNPNLKPEIIDAYQLDYNKSFEKISIISSLFYRHSINTIKAYYRLLPNGTVLNMPMNIGETDSYGIENMVAGKLTAFYDFNASVTLLQQKINASDISADAVQSSAIWYGKWINNFSVGKGGKLQIIGNYNSSALTPQGKLIPLYNVDLGFQQKFGKSNFRMNFIVVDAFNTLKSGSNSYTTTFASTKSQKADTRAFMITLAYSFKSVIKDKMLENKFSKEF